MALIFKLTPAGRAALVNAANNGSAARTIVSVGITADAIVSGNAVTNEIKRIATISGDLVDDDTMHITVRDETADAYDVRGYGLYLDNGVLLGSYGQLAAIISKTAASMMLLSIDAKVLDASADISTLEFGDTNFTYPQATTERKGVIEVATAAEVATGDDTERAVVPSTLKPLLAAKAPTSRNISTSARLTGGGNLGADRTIDLATSGVSAGTYGGANAIPTFAVDAYGRITVAGSITPTPLWSNVTGKPSVNTGTGLTGGGDLGSNRTLSLADTAVAPGTYGAATKVPRFTVDQQGRITGVSEISVTAGIPVLTSGTALPTTNIGPIWHDDYQSIMTWQVFSANGAAYTGYASLLVGGILIDTQPAPRLGYVKSGANNLSRTSYAAVRAWAQHNGIFVATGLWVAGSILVADNADGTTFRVYDVRGEFPRFWDDGRGIDVGRIFGAWKEAQFPNHGHAVFGDNTGSGANGQVASLNGGNFPISGNARAGGYLWQNGGGINLLTREGGTENNSENRPRSTPFSANVKF